MKKTRGEKSDFGLVGPKDRRDAEREDQAFRQSIVQDWSFLFISERPSERAVIPEIAVPEGVQKRNKSLGDWHVLWRRIHRAFYSESQTFTEGDPRPFSYAPSSENQWFKSVENEMSKTMSLESGAPDFSSLHQEIGSWAYGATIEEFLFRHPRLDEDRFLRNCIPHRVYFVLVYRFYAFVRARRNYHARLMEVVARGVASNPEEIPKDRLKERLNGRKGENYGRPQAFEWDSKDLWMILIWPIACRYRWTYADVARAQRLAFPEDYPHTPLFCPTEVIRYRRRYFGEGLSEVEQEWYERQLTVLSNDKNRVQMKCRSLGLMLPPKSRTGRRARDLREPRMLMILRRLPKRICFSPYSASS